MNFKKLYIPDSTAIAVNNGPMQPPYSGGFTGAIAPSPCSLQKIEGGPKKTERTEKATCKRSFSALTGWA